MPTTTTTLTTSTPTTVTTDPPPLIVNPPPDYDSLGFPHSNSGDTIEEDTTIPVTISLTTPNSVYEKNKEYDEEEEDYDPDNDIFGPNSYSGGFR